MRKFYFKIMQIMCISRQLSVREDKECMQYSVCHIIIKPLYTKKAMRYGIAKISTGFGGKEILEVHDFILRKHHFYLFDAQ